MKIVQYLTIGYKMVMNPFAGEISRSKFRGGVIGIAFSLIPLLLALSISDGMVQGITRRFIEIGTYHLQAKTYFNEDLEEVDSLVRRLRQLEGVTHVFAEIQGFGLVSSGRSRAGVAVRCIDKGIYAEDPVYRRFLSLEAGQFDLSQEKNILISSKLAGELGAAVGDTVKIFTSRILPGNRRVLRPGTYTVTGIFSTGYYELDSLAVYLNTEAGENLFGLDNPWTIGIKTDDPYGDLTAVSLEVMEILPPNWFVYNWYELNRSMYNNFRTIRIMLLFIFSIVVVVATLNISSVVIMTVLENQKEIAILKCIGIGSGVLRMNFISIGFYLGFLGCLLGTTVGLGLAYNVNHLIVLVDRIANFVYRLLAAMAPQYFGGASDFTIFESSYYLDEIPVLVKFTDIVPFVFLTLILSVLAAYLPARRIDRVRPVETIRRY